MSKLPTTKTEGALYFACKENGVQEGYLYGYFDGKLYSITSHFLDDADIAGNVTIGTTSNNKTLTVYGSTDTSSLIVQRSAIIGKSKVSDDTFTIYNHTTIGESTTTGERNLQVHGNTNISKNIEVGGTSVLKGNVTIGQTTPNLPAAVDIIGSITTSGRATFNQHVILGPESTGKSETTDCVVRVHSDQYIGNYTDSDNYEDRRLIVYGATTIGNPNREQSLTVNGTVRATNNVIFNQNLDVDGSVVIGSSRYGGANEATEDTLTVNANTTMGGTLSVAKATTLSDTLTVTKATTIGTTSAQADLTVNGDVHITGADLFLGTGTTAATRVQMTYTAGTSGDTLTITFND